MSRESTSLKQRNGRYTQGGFSDYFPESFETNAQKERVGWWERRKIPTNFDDIFVIVSKGNESRPDLISYQVYGEPDFAWLVMQYNNIVDPVQELLRGTTIRLPTASRLKIYIINRTLPNV